MSRLLVLRPEPGASQTATTARGMGFDVVIAPLFVVEPIAWTVPTGPFDALMLTSANAIRWGGASLSAVQTLPTFAVGEATASAARAAGLYVVHIGSGGAAALVAAMRDKGVGRALHLAGEVHRDVADPGFEIERVIVYRSVPIGDLPMEPEDMVALIHSPDAACLFARLVDKAGADRGRIRIAAISAAAAARTGEGWAAVGIAAQPRDAALLAIAAKLCEEAANDADGRR